MKVINQKKDDILFSLNKLIDLRLEATSKKIDSVVKKIINEVKSRGDDALIDFAKKYDNISISKSQILIPDNVRKRYKKQIDPKVLKSFEIAIENITSFHEKQLPKNYKINKDNLITGSLWNPIEAVGLYVPGGKASYPSSLLMNVIPAQVSGVKRIAVSTPSNNGNFDPYIMALLDILGIKEVYQIGGAQAIAALAYGTQRIKPVNKVFGPGNAYVVSAKKQVFGRVGIDLIAGPSEIVVVADQHNNPDWVASDLIAQAEHDEKSQCILITDNERFALRVRNKLISLSSQLKKKEIIMKSLNNYGAILILDNLENAAEIIDIIAPEHLHLQNKTAKKIFNKVKNVGCIFLGVYSSEVFGDYIVGTNHILPTSGTAKFSSGLGVLDFMKRTSYVSLNQKSFENLSNSVTDMASIENLDGHKLSVTIRQTNKK